MIHRASGPLSEARPSELNRRRSTAREELNTAPTKPGARDARDVPNASYPVTEPPRRSAVGPDASTTRRHHGSRPMPSLDPTYVPVADGDGARRNLWPRQSEPSRERSPSYSVTWNAAQSLGHIPVGPPTSRPAVSTPKQAEPSASAFASASAPAPPGCRYIGAASPSQVLSASNSRDPHSHHRRVDFARPATHNARMSSTAGPYAPSSHHRPSPFPGTVNYVPHASLAFPSSVVESHPFHGPPPRAGQDLFAMEGAHLPGFRLPGALLPDAELDDNASEEIQKLFQTMPEIEIPPEDRASTPRQMSCRLMEHQKVALKWLQDQENDRHKKGGLLADTMGLGKTIEALALIIAFRPPTSAPKTTLIVAPLALLKQWNREIADKIKPGHRLTTFIYHGREKKTKKADRLYSYDIVITTYETIASEYKHVEPDGTRKSPLYTNARGFYRIVLDEAHKIKNRNAWCSKAVAQLRARFRLCMTGTPFMNNTGEIFSLVRFLQIAPYNDWSHFNRLIEKPLRSWDEDEKGVAMQRLQVLFRTITLRRTKDSLLDGRPILRLPELTISSIAVELDEEQRAYYTAIEKKHQILINKYLKRGRLSKVITYILVLLTRLRQTCDHPYLIKSNQGIPMEATLNGKQMVQLATRFDAKVVDRTTKKKEFQCPLCDEPVEVPIIIYPCGHDICPECFSEMMKFGMEVAGDAEPSQPGPSAFLRGAEELETDCPHDNCDSKILANKVVCHDFFLAAHSPGGAFQICEEDSSGDESDDCCTSGDDDEDEDEDEDSGLDGDGDGSDADSADGNVNFKREIKYSESRSCIDRTSNPCALEDGDEAMESSVAVTEAREDEANGSLKLLLQRSPSPESAPVPEPSLPELGNDLWGRVLTHHRQGVYARPDSNSNSNPELDSDLESLSGLAAKSKPTTPMVGLSAQVTAKRKRGFESEKLSLPRHRVKLEHVDEDEPKRRLGKARRKGKKKSKKAKDMTPAQLKKLGSTSKAVKAKYFDHLRRDWESSAKVDVTVELLRKIRNEKPGEKTLVFSLWTSFLDLLEIPLQDEKFRYLRYDGSMTFNERDDNVKAFSEDRHENILLVSLMAGNAGLNLTAASQVIILEPFWNPYVEDQAIDRAHRIGQLKAVEVHRLLVPDSVEDRILALQEKKRKLVDTALSEEGAQGASRLSIQELRGLFGLS